MNDNFEYFVHPSYNGSLFSFNNASKFDTTQLAKQMTKNTRGASHFDESSPLTREGPTKYRKDHSRRRTGHRLDNQMFFLPVFLQDKNVCKYIGLTLGISNRIN